MHDCEHFIVFVNLSVVHSGRWHCSWEVINWCLCAIWHSVAKHSCNAVRWSESGKRQGSCSSPYNSSDYTANKSFLCQTSLMNCFNLISDAIPRQLILKMATMIYFNEFWKFYYLHKEFTSKTMSPVDEWKGVTNAYMIASKNLMVNLSSHFHLFSLTMTISVLDSHVPICIDLCNLLPYFWQENPVLLIILSRKSVCITLSIIFNENPTLPIDFRRLLIIWFQIL